MEKNKVSIFYDGGCRVCSWEIQKYLAADVKQNLTTIDINAKDFSAETYGLDADRVRKYFHVLNREGRLVAGVDAFIEIWKALDSPFWMKASRWAKFPAVHFFLRAGYRVFVEVRPWLPRKPGAPECVDNSCEIK